MGKRIDNFRRRMSFDGGTLRDERIIDFRRMLLKSWEDDPSYIKEGAILFGTDPPQLIYPRMFEQRDPLTGSPKTQFQTQVGEPFESGSIFTLENGDNWLCIYKPNKHEMYHQGTFVYCNYTLRYFSPISGNLIECPVVMQNATQYNSGETSGQNMIFGTSQHIVLIPSSDETNLLDRGFRFLIDVNHIHPTSYKITQVDPTTNFKGGQGVLRWTVSEDALRVDDDIENMIASQDSIIPERFNPVFEPEMPKKEGWFDD